MLMADYSKKLKIQSKNIGKGRGSIKAVRKVARMKMASHKKVLKQRPRPKTIKKQAKAIKQKIEKKGNAISKSGSGAKVIEEIINNREIYDYITKNVGKKAAEIIPMLGTPISDEELANKTNIKINEVRRILNTLNTYGLTKYDTIKDKNGWLTFKWYINEKNIENVKKNVEESSKVLSYKLPDDCNDFFVCDTCFEKRKVLFPFDTAVEMKFKCDCGGNLVRISKEEAKRLVENGNIVTK